MPKPTLSATFASNLKTFRLASGLSQGALAEKADLSVSYVSMLERERRSPPLETIESLAKALKTHPINLLA